MLIYVFGFRDQEEQAAGAALLLVGVDERRAAGDRVSDVNRLQVFEGVATVEPALAILQRLWQGRRLGAERDHERGGRSSRQRGSSSPIASQKRRRWPASTVVTRSAPDHPTLAFRRSTIVGPST